MPSVDDTNVTTMLLAFLAEEEANVASAEEEVLRCTAAVEHHKERIRRLRAALEALGVEAGSYTVDTPSIM